MLHFAKPASALCMNIFPNALPKVRFALLAAFAAVISFSRFASSVPTLSVKNAFINTSFQQV